MINLRDYQDDAVEALRQAYRDGFRAPLLELSTGGGKTTIFGYITANAATKGKTIFLIAHRSELIKQIAGTLAKFGAEHRVIAPGAIVTQCKIEQFKALNRSFVTNDARIIVSSVQTMARRLDSINLVPDIIVIDEAHHLTKKSQWGQVVWAYPNAKLLLVSATPCRLDGKGLGVEADGFAEIIIPGPPMAWLIENGFLSPYKVYAPPHNIDLKSIKKRMGDYAKNELSAAVDRPSIIGDVVGHYKRLANGKRAVAFCVSIKHAEHVAASFLEHGIPAEVLDGTLDAAERDARIKRFEAGETLVLCSCDVVSEGFDLPAIEVAILLRPTESLSLFLQQVGRALRVLPGKQFAIILDHVGAIMRHGLPDAPRDWTLDGVKKRDSSSQGGQSIKTCSECFCIHAPAPTCPACGFVYKVGKGRQLTQVDGELVELTDSKRLEMKAEAEEKKRAIQAARKAEERTARTVDDFLAIGKARGYRYPQQWAEKRASFRRAK